MAQTINRVLVHNWSDMEIRKTISDRTWESVAKEVQTVFKKVLIL